ncbi:alkaline phosphatase family protein [Bacillus sp. FJAT-27251]|uniref:LTA synthase family protein n=1 Tax=Bacillus sp. FJAT-27251 TaxID=1684142 RepID=UPI0006A7875C|nr:alkaline phosphatase family protein [Bacillus sp. FJAT-27251]
MSGLEPKKNEKLRRKLIIKFLTVFFIIGLPIVTLITSELIVREALDMPFLLWTSEFTKRFLINLLLMIALFNIFYILPRKFFMAASILASGTLIFFAFANKLKLELRNSPITIGDFALFNELRGLDQPLEINIFFLIAILLAIGITIVAIFLLTPNSKENWLIKIGGFFISLSFLYILWTDYPISPMSTVKFENTWWRQELGTMRNGLYGNFVMLAKQNQIPPPNHYSKESIQSIAERYKPLKSEATERPNVIFLMSEAFTDPLHFGSQHFTQDPIPNFRNLYNESLHGSMYSPEFGGGTANVEFEALTGFSRQFLPDNSIAYQSYVKRPLPSVAYSFRKAGYHATAIHPFYGWYYQRQGVYRHLGFNQFISGEFMDLDYTLGSGHGYPKDKHLTDTILSQIKYTKERDFIHAVSVEAHQPYRPLADSKFLKIGTLPDSTRMYLNAYTEYMYSVDQELGRLITELKSLNEPSILVFFGDHYPTFASNHEVYGSLGTNIANNMLSDYDDFLNTHVLPYFIWKSHGNSSSELNLSPSQFSALSLEMAGVQGNTVTSIQDELRKQKETVIPYKTFQSQMGNLTKEMKDLQLLQYDLLHGKRYSQNQLSDYTPKTSEEYFLGQYKTMEFIGATDLSNHYNITAFGVPRHANLINENNKKIESEWQGSEKGNAVFRVNKKDIDTKKSYHFIVHDSRGNILKTTKPFKLEAN